MAVSLLDVLFTARPVRSSPPPDRLYSTGALLTSAVIVSVLARRHSRSQR